MREEQLISFLQARGVDFEYTAGNSSDTDGIARRRRLSKGERDREIPAVLDTVKGVQTRVYRKPTWSAELLSLALAGVTAEPELAVSYSIAGDSSAFWPLMNKLNREAAHLVDHEGWPQCVHTVENEPLFYIPPMLQLLLTEEAYPHVFAQAATAPAHAWLLNIPPGIWNRVLNPKYQALQTRYRGWLEEGRQRVRRRILGGKWGPRKPRWPTE